VEYAYATENKMAYTKMKNAAGKTVSPNIESFQAAAANADFTTVQDFYLILTNQKGENSWPITGSTWSLQRKDASKETNQGVTQFLSFCLTSGQEQAKNLDYVPLPENTVAKIKDYWKSQLGI
jgi:phosphate transport system substrate-binding protein